MYLFDRWWCAHRPRLNWFEMFLNCGQVAAAEVPPGTVSELMWTVGVHALWRQFWNCCVCDRLLDWWCTCPAETVLKCWIDVNCCVCDRLLDWWCTWNSGELMWTVLFVTGNWTSYWHQCAMQGLFWSIMFMWTVLFVTGNWISYWHQCAMRGLFWSIEFMWTVLFVTGYWTSYW